MSKLAVVVFNLGGPDRPESVKPFLFNLFNDPAIIGAAPPIRWLLAKWISARRAPVARKIYQHLGGKSPLLELTNDQARALEGRLGGGDDQVKVFIAMRYWHPLTEQTVAAVKDFVPDQIVLLPLYPQFSTTTTGSSIAAWHRIAGRLKLQADTRAVCCYPCEPGWVAAQASLIAASMGGLKNLRLLFSAHGLPKKVIAAGDPYQWQVEQTAAAVVDRLKTDEKIQSEWQWAVCYQSRVGPLEWIGPPIEDELKRAAADGIAVVVVPIAFVSEHSETLVELDIEYKAEAEKLGVPEYRRTPAVGIHPAFIDGLAATVRRALDDDRRIAGGCENGDRLCPAALGQCPMKTNAEDAR